MAAASLNKSLRLWVVRRLRLAFSASLSDVGEGDEAEATDQVADDRDPGVRRDLVEADSGSRHGAEEQMVNGHDDVGRTGPANRKPMRYATTILDRTVSTA